MYVLKNITDSEKLYLHGIEEKTFLNETFDLLIYTTKPTLALQFESKKDAFAIVKAMNRNLRVFRICGICNHEYEVLENKIIMCKNCTKKE